MRFVAPFSVLVLLGLLVTGGLEAAPPPLTACGAPGKGPCALQEWMREQLARPYALRRFDELAGNASALVSLNPNPAEWKDWNDFAQAAARAAQAHDEEHVLQACTRCHHSYRREYVEKYRMRALLLPH